MFGVLDQKLVEIQLNTIVKKEIANDNDLVYTDIFALKIKIIHTNKIFIYILIFYFY